MSQDHSYIYNESYFFLRKKADRPPSYQKEKSTLIRIDYNKPNTKEHKIFENKTIDLVETNKKDIDEKDSEKKIKKEEEIDGQSLIKCSGTIILEIKILEYLTFVIYFSCLEIFNQ